MEASELLVVLNDGPVDANVRVHLPFSPASIFSVSRKLFPKFPPK